MWSKLKPIISLIKLGDWLVMGGSAIAIAASLPLMWQGGYAERALVKQEGRTVAELSLRERKIINLTSNLGITRIEVQPPRARVAADPGMRQYCVLQGWLSRPGEIAICAPTRISLQIVGRQRVYDSLNY